MTVGAARAGCVFVDRRWFVICLVFLHFLIDLLALQVLMECKLCVFFFFLVLSFKNNSLHLLFVYLCVLTCYGTHLGVRGQLS